MCSKFDMCRKTDSNDKLLSATSDQLCDDRQSTGRATRKTGAEKSRDMTIYGEGWGRRTERSVSAPIDTFPSFEAAFLFLPSPILSSSIISTCIPTILFSWLALNPSSRQNRLISFANQFQYAMCAFFSLPIGDTISRFWGVLDSSFSTQPTKRSHYMS